MKTCLQLLTEEYKIYVVKRNFQESKIRIPTIITTLEATLNKLLSSNASETQTKMKTRKRREKEKPSGLTHLKVKT